MQSVATVKNLSMAESGLIERLPSAKAPIVKLKSFLSDQADLKGSAEVSGNIK